MMSVSFLRNLWLDVLFSRIGFIFEGLWYFLMEYDWVECVESFSCLFFLLLLGNGNIVCKNLMWIRICLFDWWGFWYEIILFILFVIMIY